MAKTKTLAPGSFLSSVIEMVLEGSRIGQIERDGRVTPEFFFQFHGIFFRRLVIQYKMEKRPGTDNTETDLKRQKMTEEENKQEAFSTVGSAVNQLGEEGSGKADAEGHPVQEIESLCMNCHENGTTRLLMTRIPYFREVIIMSFFCPHCGFKNSEIQPAGVIQDKGSKHVLQLDDPKDLNRQVVKSETASCKFGELDIEIPPKKGLLTTVEGLLSQIHDDLSSDQPVRKHVDPEGYEKIETFLNKVDEARNGKLLPLTFTVDDPTGNSWIEFVPGEPSHKWSHVDYFRTKQQNVALGISQEQVEEAAQSGRQIQINNTNRNASTAEKIQEEASEIENFHGEVQTFTASCPSCSSPDCQTNMKPVNIPHFKEVLIFSTVCHACGYKSNEVKTGGAIPEKGRRVTLKVDDPDDLSRDILKSESCGMTVPELNLDLTPGTLGGRSPPSKVSCDKCTKNFTVEFSANNTTQWMLPPRTTGITSWRVYNLRLRVIWNLQSLWKIRWQRHIFKTYMRPIQTQI